VGHPNGAHDRSVGMRSNTIKILHSPVTTALRPRSTRVDPDVKLFEIPALYSRRVDGPTAGRASNATSGRATSRKPHGSPAMTSQSLAGMRFLRGCESCITGTRTLPHLANHLLHAVGPTPSLSGRRISSIYLSQRRLSQRVIGVEHHAMKRRT